MYNLFRWLAQFSSINNHLILNFDLVGLAILGGWNPYQTTKFAEEANLWTIICHCHGPGITHHQFEVGNVRRIVQVRYNVSQRLGISRPYRKTNTAEATHHLPPLWSRLCFKTIETNAREFWTRAMSKYTLNYNIYPNIDRFRSTT